MSTLKDLAIVANTSAPAQLNGTGCAVKVTTTEASTITVERSVDGTNFKEIPEISFAVNGSEEFNLTDFVPGQYVRVVSTGAMTVCKVLS